MALRLGHLAILLAASAPLAAQDSSLLDESGEAPICEPDQDGGIDLRCPSYAEEPPAENDWHARLPHWFDLDAEYRARTIYINPLELNDTGVRAIDWTEHRLRIGASFNHGGWLAIHTRLDILDGVLWGDNGEFSDTPAPNSGLSIATRRPNETSLGVGLGDGLDPLDPDSYGPQLQSADSISIDHAYADVVLPFGLLRIGRQPASNGASLGGHDGGRHNRWGASSYGDIADRFLFGTKLDEAVRVIRGGAGEVNPSMDDGVVLATWLDLYNTGNLYAAGDNLRQNGLLLSWNVSEADWGGADWSGIQAAVGFVNLGNDNFATKIRGFPFILKGSVGLLTLEANVAYLHGQTRELSEGLSVLNPRPAATQNVRALGARVVADFEVGPAVFTFEFDYAGGDDDPRQESVISTYNYPRDLNIGLLMFERTLAYESARVAAVGAENLRNLEAPSFPLTEASTEGRFTNAVALFPQILVNLVDNDEHVFHTRFGVLMAWPEAKLGAVDPVITSLSEDGEEISDDAVNFHGGAPGNYYGTEFDLQLGWTFRQNFFWTLEGAALLPGSSMQDENGDAVPSFMLENRFEFVF
jgi:hypothetical protein